MSSRTSPAWTSTRWRSRPQPDRVTPQDPEARLQHALDLAYRYLGRRERTALEVSRHLESKGIEPATAGEALAELGRQGYVDDVRYAQMFAEDRRKLDGWGTERIERRLAQVGVDPEIVAILQERGVVAVGTVNTLVAELAFFAAKTIDGIDAGVDGIRIEAFLAFIGVKNQITIFVLPRIVRVVRVEIELWCPLQVRSRSASEQLAELSKKRAVEIERTTGLKHVPFVGVPIFDIEHRGRIFRRVV